MCVCVCTGKSLSLYYCSFNMKLCSCRDLVLLTSVSLRLTLTGCTLDDLHSWEALVSTGQQGCEGGLGGWRGYAEYCAQAFHHLLVSFTQAERICLLARSPRLSTHFTINNLGRKKKKPGGGGGGTGAGAGEKWTTRRTDSETVGMIPGVSN